jgi:hypothetical protein
VYDALLVVGRSGAIQYRSIVEKYLTASNNPMLARLALMILCRYWNLAPEYKMHVLSFIQGVTWDNEGDVRILAISIAGTMLASQQDDHLIRLLIDIFRNRSNTEDQLSREVAYCSLAEAYGRKPYELPTASRHFDLERDIDPEVIDFIESEEKRLKGRGSKDFATPPTGENG